MERLSVLKHADDTVLLAEDEEGLRIAVQAFERWCRKWQVAPNPGKCEVVVFEHSGNTRPRIELGGQVLKVTKQAVYLGYVLDRRGSWTAHVSRRITKAAMWDCLARKLVGSTGGCTVEAAAHVRASAADASALYGAGMWAGLSQRMDQAVDTQQAGMARALLGVRTSAESCGVLTELGWQAMRHKARAQRFFVGGEYWLLRTVEQQALSDANRGTAHQKSEFNWWKHTASMVQDLVRASSKSTDDLRAMTKDKFRDHVKLTLWHEEYEERLRQMRKHSRLQRLATELDTRAHADPARHAKCRRWPSAAYLRKVGSQYHARAIAMVRLDLMSVDWEIDRWNRVPYAERRCRECGATRGDVCHLISGCPALPALRGGEDGAACWNFLVNAQHEDGAMWRRVARHIEQSWRGLEQARNTRKTTAGHAPGLLLGVLSH